MPAISEPVWQQLWKALDVLDARARDLRRLSQEEPLRKARPDYPHAGVGRSHDDEVRAVFADLAKTFAEVSRLLPAVLPDGFDDMVAGAPLARAAGPGSAGAVPSGVAADETPAALAGRLSTLEKLTAGLAREAFAPPPPLPPHAPPYLVTIPGHDLPGTKALLLGNAIKETVTALRNTLVAAANAAS